MPVPAVPGSAWQIIGVTPTRFPIFHQFEGLAVDRGITLADLKGTLLHVMRALFGEDREVRFRTHYFPFTEPSIEPDVSCPSCDFKGCRMCKFTGWIELGGAGMVDSQVLENVGIDAEEWSGFAFGCGLERAAQLRDGKAPGDSATGLVVRGYVSKIDGAVQPYGLVVPASYRPDSPRRFRLEHGDIAVWGGPARLVFHGVAALADGEHALMGRQRINLTFRKAR